LLLTNSINFIFCIKLAVSEVCGSLVGPSDFKFTGSFLSFPKKTSFTNTLNLFIRLQSRCIFVINPS